MPDGTAAPTPAQISSTSGNPPGQQPTNMSEVIATVARLRSTFPRAFSPDHPPLRIGVHEDIRAQMPDVPAEVIHAALRLWTCHESYKLSIACQFRRVGL